MTGDLECCCLSAHLPAETGGGVGPRDGVQACSSLSPEGSIWDLVREAGLSGLLSGHTHLKTFFRVLWCEQRIGPFSAPGTDAPASATATGAGWGLHCLATPCLLPRALVLTKPNPALTLLPLQGPDAWWFEKG